MWSCDLWLANFIYLFWISHCTSYQMGPPNPKWRMGRSLVLEIWNRRTNKKSHVVTNWSNISEISIFLRRFLVKQWRSRCVTPIPVYCRIQIKSTPLRDRDTPDEIFFSSLHFGSRDMAKISSVIAIELYILTMFGVKLIVAVHRQSQN